LRSKIRIDLRLLFAEDVTFEKAIQARADESTRAQSLSRRTRLCFHLHQDKLVDWVLNERVAAGASSNDLYAALPNGGKANITILAETASLPRHLVSIRKDLALAVTNRLKKILLSMLEDPPKGNV
jgi:hypothetical protein